MIGWYKPETDPRIHSNRHKKSEPDPVWEKNRGSGDWVVIVGINQMFNQYNVY